MPPATAAPPPAQPASLTGHTVPPERLDQIRPHIDLLAKTALMVSDQLTLDADASDFVAALEEGAP